ncbi:hypothetical protein TNCV_1224271 [Trichonephila clavipes]|nr:hypothetical protein TNCV_1224271 [Trichonephila clavipes]
MEKKRCLVHVRFNGIISFLEEGAVWKMINMLGAQVVVSRISKTQKSTHVRIKIQSNVAFFDINGIVINEGVLSGQTVNQHRYIETLKRLHEKIREKKAKVAECWMAAAPRQCTCSHGPICQAVSD